jgi:GT2 family glycosyltransferase
MVTICVIILNYGTADLAIASAVSALADIDGLSGEVVVVDNASPDSSYQKLMAWRSALPPDTPVHVIPSPTNSGYSGGNNLGLKSRDAEYYVLLNSDTLVKPGAFSKMLESMRRDNRIGLLGPKLIDGNGNSLISRFRFPSPVSEFVQATGTDVFYRWLRGFVVPIRDEEDAQPEWIGFPCVMLRKATLAEIGYLDERYFMYFEDIDYCRRVSRGGWKIEQCKAAVVQHFCGQSSQVEEKFDSKSRLPAYYYASRTRYFTAWYGRIGYIWANCLWYIGRFISHMRILFGRPPTSVCKGFALDIWTGPDQGRPSSSA